LGFSQQKNENKKLFKENTILSRIAILLGGRTAEKIIYNNVSTGAADDIEKASSLIYNYTCSWGMNKHIGPLNPEVMGAVGRNLSEESFEECKQIMAEIEDYVFKTLKKHKKYVKSIAKLLLKEETINYKQIKDLVPEKLENTLTVTIS
jgi:cell division protease FtsH